MVKKTSVRHPERLTITLGRGQREALQTMAERNNTNMAFLVRYALAQFIQECRQKQLKLDL